MDYGISPDQARVFAEEVSAPAPKLGDCRVQLPNFYLITRRTVEPDWRGGSSMDDYHPSPMGNWPALQSFSVGGRQSVIGISDNPYRDLQLRLTIHLNPLQIYSKINIKICDVTSSLCHRRLRFFFCIVPSVAYASVPRDFDLTLLVYS